MITPGRSSSSTSTGGSRRRIERSAREMDYAPYPEPATNQLYHLLFCDEPRRFAPGAGQLPAPWQATLFHAPTDPEAVRALADDRFAEGRVRALAYGWLRANGHAVPKRVLLGVVVEVALDDGLDVLAAYSDGGVRYIHHTGKLVFVDGGVPTTAAVVTQLLAASRAVIDRIGPANERRRPPPSRGDARLTFLVSDGPYFGEGAMAALQQDALAGPVLRHATELLQRVVAIPAK